MGRPFVKQSPNAIRPLGLSVCPVCNAYCAKTVGWIKMKLGIQVCLGPGHIVFDEDSAPLPQRGSSKFSAHISVVAKWLDRLRCHLVWRYRRPRPRRHCVRWGPSFPPLKGHSPQFSANVRCGPVQTDGLRCHLVWR